MEWVETTGRTVADALDAALDQLGVDEDDVEFEVMQEPKSGLLGRREAHLAPRAPVDRERREAACTPVVRQPIEERVRRRVAGLAR